LAMPLLRPGQSLKFASLPQGNDPDDLFRAGGREAIADVVERARPLAEVLWMRESEAGSLETPERRAAFEARLAHVIASIGDDAVRKHYRREFGDRLRRLFATDDHSTMRQQRARSGRNLQLAWSQGSNKLFRNKNGRAPVRRSLVAGEPYVASSQQLAASPVHRGHRAAISRREALILQAIINHPWLLHDHLEELARLEFRHSEAALLKAALIDVVAHGGASDAEAVMVELGKRGLANVAVRLQKAITTPSVWGASTAAAPDDVLTTWKQLVALHRQWHSLAKELRDAEHALGQDSNEVNYSWLQDVKARLSGLEGTEALIEGFGASSGRPVRSL
jgi:DNA primase